MTNTNAQTLSMLEILPEEEQKLAMEFVKRMVLAWDPDYTKLTSDEKYKLEIAEKEIENGEVFSQEEVIKMLNI